jgi:arginyl-tRNA--protein-N-Asp/Glu arginylyltransferase
MTPTGGAARALKQDGRDKTTGLQSFHVLPETPCPYLPGRRERKLFTDLTGPRGRRLYDTLSQAGFRRSHRFAYRPACTACAACVPVRIRVADFRPGETLRRIARRNADLVVEERPARATLEQYRLFDRYIAQRHGDGDMAAMTFSDYQAMVEETVLDTRLVEFRLPDGRLAAAGLIDWLEDGPSAVYSFFLPELAERSLGSQVILWLAAEAARRDLPHAYLGYWIAETRKMAYKARFRPLEALGPKGWSDLAAS